MAARKVGALNENWRDRIQSSMLINRLQDHVKGNVELNRSQVAAAVALLKKTVPDLSALAIAAGPGVNVAFILQNGPQIIDAKAHSPMQITGIDDVAD